MNNAQKKELELLRTQVTELTKFKERVELGQRWLLCVVYAIGGVAAFAATILSILKDWPKVH
jgi:hypothetical protein